MKKYTVRHGNNWAVKGVNNSRTTIIIFTQNDTIETARSIAINQKSEMRLQDSHGKFKVCNSYGNDSYPSKDKKYQHATTVFGSSMCISRSNYYGKY